MVPRQAGRICQALQACIVPIQRSCSRAAAQTVRPICSTPRTGDWPVELAVDCPRDAAALELVCRAHINHHGALVGGSLRLHTCNKQSLLDQLPDDRSYATFPGTVPRLLCTTSGAEAASSNSAAHKRKAPRRAGLGTCQCKPQASAPATANVRKQADERQHHICLAAPEQC